MQLARKLSKRTLQLLTDAAIRWHRHGAILQLPAKYIHLRRRIHNSQLYVFNRLVSTNEANDLTKCFYSLLHFIAQEIRPDRNFGTCPVPDISWVDSTKWRIYLSLYCQIQIISVPDKPKIYYRKQHESTADNLCGLWSVGPSTFYRYIERARAMVVERLVNLQNNSQYFIEYTQYLINHAEIINVIHQQEISDGFMALLKKKFFSEAVWIANISYNYEIAYSIASKHRLEIASNGPQEWVFEIPDHGTENLAAKSLRHLSQSLVFQVLGNNKLETYHLELALGAAHQSRSNLAIGLCQSAIAQLEMTSDLGSAESRAKQALNYLNNALHENLSAPQIDIISDIALVRLRLAWIHVRRGAPIGKKIFQEAVDLCVGRSVSSLVQATVNIVESEICRREGKLAEALNLEREGILNLEASGNTYALLLGYNNLGLIHTESGDSKLGIEYCSRVVNALELLRLNAPLLENAKINIGVAYMYQGNFEKSIQIFNEALTLNKETGRKLNTMTIHFNLAECFYKCHLATGLERDIHNGDIHREITESIARDLNIPNVMKTAQELKSTVLGDAIRGDQFSEVGDFAPVEEISRIVDLRDRLASACDLKEIAFLRLELSRMYLKLAVSERSEAINVAKSHNFYDSISDSVSELNQRWLVPLDFEQELCRRWRVDLGDLVSTEKIVRLIKRLSTNGYLSKSSYGETAEVSPATASKHLGLLADKGLLQQQGRGPATRYVLPSMASGDSSVAPSVH